MRTKIEHELNTTEARALKLYRQAEADPNYYSKLMAKSKENSLSPVVHSEKIQKLSDILKESFPQPEPNRNDEKTVIKVYNLEQSKEQIENFKKAGYYFTVKETATSCKIEHFLVGGRKTIWWYLENTKSDYFLILLNQIKKEMEERKFNIEACVFSDSIQRIKYFDFARTVQRHIDDDAGACYEIYNAFEADISHAYYRAAHVINFMSEMLYLKIINTLSKQDRLKLLGCIASVKVIRTFKNGKMIGGELKKSELHRSAWFKICHYVDCALLELKRLLGENFLFYWVDGIYFRQEGDDLTNAYYHNYINSIEQKYDLQFKITPLPKIQILNTGKQLEVRVEKPDGKTKLFLPKRQQVREYSFLSYPGNEV